MKHMTLKNICDCCDGVYSGDESKLDTEVSGIAIDSRKVPTGGLFVAIRGERVDGHSYIPAAMRAGAIACLVETPQEGVDIPCILVRSTLEALRRMAAYYRQSLDVRVVGISGSVGKTSTKEMVAAVLGEQYMVHKTAGNFNNEIGLPLTVFGITEYHQAAVLEMGISDFGEMHRLAEIANPDIAIITNIGLCHLENLGSRDGILKAKTEMFAHLREGAAVILNGDDDKLAAVPPINGKKPIFYGKEKGDVFATELQLLGMEGIRMKLHMHGACRTVTIPIPGEHTAYNALAAACAGDACGMDLDAICRGLEKAKTISGRSNFIQNGKITVIDDCYNANPVSMRASIDVLSQAPGRKIAVLGDMGELGIDECKLHAQVGRYVAQKQIDLLFCAGGLCKEMARAAQNVPDSHTAVSYFEQKEDLLNALLPAIQSGDTILVKASHFMQFFQIVEALTA